MASRSSKSSDHLAAASKLFESLLLQIPDVRLEEMFTFKEREKKNHRQNYLSKTTQYSTAFMGEFLNRFPEENNSIFSFGETFKKLEPERLLEDYYRRYELLLRELNKITIRDISRNFKESFGFLPRTTNKTNKKDYVTYSDPQRPATTLFYGTIYWEVETIIKSFDNVPEDVVAIILAKLPTSDIYHGRSVCKTWNSVITTNLSFRSNFNKSFRRRPRFLLLDKEKSFSSAVVNMEADAPGAWFPVPTTGTTKTNTQKFVISSGGLMCIWSGSDSFTVFNPLTGSSHCLPSVISDSDGGHSIKGMAMHSSPYSESAGRLRFQVFVVIKKRDSELRIKSYSSTLKDQDAGAWIEELGPEYDESMHVWDTATRTGVITIDQQGKTSLHFVNGSRSKSVSFHIHTGAVFTIPIFHLSSQCSLASQLVICDGSLFSVVLSYNIQQRLTQLEIYQFSSDQSTNGNASEIWIHFTTMPEDLSTMCCINRKDYDHAFSCAGHGNYIMVYMTCSSDFTPRSNYTLMFTIKEKSWDLLQPQFSSDTRTGHKMEICSLMPDID